MLEGAGYTPAARVEDASVILLNTCSVRAKPERKVYSKLGELRELKAQNPDLVIGVCGCMAQKEAPGNPPPRARMWIWSSAPGRSTASPPSSSASGRSATAIVATDLPDRKDRHDKATPAARPGRLDAQTQVVRLHLLRLRQVLPVLHRPDHARQGALPARRRDRAGSGAAGVARHQTGDAAGPDGQLLRQVSGRPLLVRANCWSA